MAAATKKKESKELAEVKENLPVEWADELDADAEEYREALGKEDMSIPFISALQQISNQCNEDDNAFVEGAKPGMFFNSLTGDLLDGKKEGIRLLSVGYHPSFIEWIPRSANAGSGFIKEHTIGVGQQAITVRNDANEDIIQQGSPVGQVGNQMSLTHTHMVFLIAEDGTYTPAVIALAATQIKHSKKWNAIINQLKLPNSAKTAPRFFGIWKAMTFLEEGNGNKWYSWKFEKVDDVTTVDGGRDMYAEAKEFAKSIKSGEVTVDHDKGAPQTSTGENPDVVDEEGGEEIPF